LGRELAIIIGPERGERGVYRKLKIFVIRRLNRYQILLGEHNRKKRRLVHVARLLDMRNKYKHLGWKAGRRNSIWKTSG
jgi:hypothetical protein